MYYKGSSCGGGKIYLNLITCKDKTFIPSKLQSYVLHWYHTYLLSPGMDRTDVMIRQDLYWPDTRYAVWEEVTNCDTCQRTKLSNKKYGKLAAKLSEEIPWNRLYVYLIGPYVIRRKGKKEKLHLKAVVAIYPITGWFELAQYEDKRVISIANLVETTWMSRYPRPIEIIYEQGK